MRRNTHHVDIIPWYRIKTKYKFKASKTDFNTIIEEDSFLLPLSADPFSSQGLAAGQVHPIPVANYESALVGFLTAGLSVRKCRPPERSSSSSSRAAAVGVHTTLVSAAGGFLRLRVSPDRDPPALAVTVQRGGVMRAPCGARGHRVKWWESVSRRGATANVANVTSDDGGELACKGAEPEPRSRECVNKRVQLNTTTPVTSRLLRAR